MRIEKLASYIDAAGFKIGHNSTGKIIVEGFPRIIDAWNKFNVKNPDVSCMYLEFQIALQYIADLQNSFE